MAYVKHEFKSGDKLYAYQLNEMDEQIYKNESSLQKLSLGIHTDGMVYIMLDGAPIGNGVELGGAISGYVDENNNIIVSGNLPDGTYSVKYEMDNATIDIGNLVIDSNVYYSVTNALTYCTSSGASQAVGGGSYTATITANNGYALKTVTVTMGGMDVTASAVNGGTISIGNVTGNIVITAVAEEIKAAEPVTEDIALTDKTSIVLDAAGSDRANTAGYCATPHIDLRNIPKPCTIHLTKAKWAFETATESGYIRFHAADVNGTKLVGDYTHPSKMPSGVTMTLNNSVGDITVTVSSDNIGTIRFAGQWANINYSDSNNTLAEANTKVTLTYTPAS